MDSKKRFQEPPSKQPGATKRIRAGTSTVAPREPSRLDLCDSPSSGSSTSMDLSSLSSARSTTNTAWGVALPTPGITTRLAWMSENASKIANKQKILQHRRAAKHTAETYSTPLVLWDIFCNENFEGNTAIGENKVVAFMIFVIRTMSTEAMLSAERGTVKVNKRHQNEIGLTTADPADDPAGAAKEAESIQNSVREALESAGEDQVYIWAPPPMSFIKRCFAALRSEMAKQQKADINCAGKSKVVQAMASAQDRYRRLLVYYAVSNSSATYKKSLNAPTEGQDCTQESFPTYHPSLSLQEMESRSSELGGNGSDKPESAPPVIQPQTQPDPTLDALREGQAKSNQQETIGLQILERLEAGVEKILSRQADLEAQTSGLRIDFLSFHDGLSRIALNHGVDPAVLQETSSTSPPHAEGAWLSRAADGSRRLAQVLSRSLSWSPSGSGDD